jgi:hypothetical protein
VLRRAGGHLAGCLGDRRLRTRLGGVALALILLFTLAALLGELFLLAAQQLGMAAGLVGAALQLGLVDHRRGGLDIGLGHRSLVALDEGALLAHLDLNRACLARRIGLLDLAGALARDADLLALDWAQCRGSGRNRASAPCRLGQRVVVDAFATPADWSCSSSAAAGRLSSAANWATVVTAIVAFLAGF